MGSSKGSTKVQNQIFWKLLWNKALDLIFPPICPGCGAFGAAPCTMCLSKLEPFPSECGFCRKLTRDSQTHQQCKAHFPLSRLIVAVKYTDVSSKIIEEIKYKYVTSLVDFVAMQMLATLRNKIANSELQPVFVPVPLHPKRQRERGFNQSELIATALANAYSQEKAEKAQLKVHSGTPPGIEHRSNTPACQVAVSPQKTKPFSAPSRALNLLVRTRYTTPQAKLSREKRLQNLSSAFALNTSAPLPPSRSLFILVDDVVTTGATLTACARVLKQAFPFHPVWGLAYARRAKS